MWLLGHSIPSVLPTFHRVARMARSASGKRKDLASFFSPNNFIIFINALHNPTFPTYRQYKRFKLCGHRSMLIIYRLSKAQSIYYVFVRGLIQTGPLPRLHLAYWRSFQLLGHINLGLLAQCGSKAFAAWKSPQRSWRSTFLQLIWLPYVKHSQNSDANACSIGEVNVDLTNRPCSW